MNLALGGALEWEALCYEQSNPSTMQFIQNQYNNLSSRLLDAGRDFMDRGRKAIEFYSSNAVLDFSKSIVNKINTSSDAQHILPLYKLEDFQQSNLLMQRWVMANPSYRVKYLDQKVDGYSETYVNMDDKDVGENHYDYRRATDGLINFNDEHGWSANIYLDPLRDGDRDLLFTEQMDIQDTWAVADLLLALGKDDPTSKTGGML